MKSSTLRAGAALACALVLSACGGSDGDFAVGGTFYGVTKPGLVLTNNGGSDLTIEPTSTGTGTFFFQNLVETDSSYNVKVKSMPSNALECKEINNTGKVAFDVRTVQIVCTIKQHALRGSVAGLTGTLELVNGADRVTVAPGATSFAMANINEDAPYGITVLNQPANQTCTVANGSGTMGQADVTNVAITCGPRT